MAGEVFSMVLHETGTRFFSPERRTVALCCFVLSIAAGIGFMAAHQIVLVFVAVLVSIFALFVVSQPNFATLAVVFILYTNAAGIAVKFHHLPFVLGASFPLLLVVPLIYYLYFRRQAFVITPVMLLLVLFFLIQILGTIFTDKGVTLALPELMTFIIEGIVLYFLVTNVIRTPEMLRRAIWMLLLAGLFMGGLSFYQQVTHTFTNNYGGFAQNDNQGLAVDVTALPNDSALHRMAGPVGEKNRYAQIMLMLVPLGMFRFWGERSRWLKLLAALCATFALIGSALTFSRGGAVGLMLMLAILYFAWLSP